MNMAIQLTLASAYPVLFYVADDNFARATLLRDVVRTEFHRPPLELNMLPYD